MTEAPIEIVEYDSRWPALFARERELMAEALAQWLTGPPEHIGSTAVPGLAAKPIIDIMAPVGSLADSEAAIVAAECIGYVYFPYKAELMHWFCKPSPACRTHHLHLVPAGGRLWRERLAFRDALRRDAALRAEYQALKLRLAAEYRHDRETYTDAKSPFISRVVQAVLGDQGSAA
ncbi:MAG: GrpB family protein [Lautropia sp.]